MGGAGFIVASQLQQAHAAALQQRCRQGTGREAVFQGVRPFPAATHHPNVLRAVLKQPLGHSGAVHQRCCEQQRSGAHPVEGAGAIGGAHKDPPAADALRRDRQRGIAQIKPIKLLAAALASAQ